MLMSIEPGPIPLWIGDLLRLVELRLDRNNLQGKIPAVVGNLQKLETLYLAFNRLSGSVPNEIFTISKLFDLRLQRNSFTGSLSNYSMESFGYLDISNNYFTGTIRMNFATKHSKLFVVISSNCFIPIIPSSKFCQGFQYVNHLFMDGFSSNKK